VLLISRLYSVDGRVYEAEEEEEYEAVGGMITDKEGKVL
jgi:hypothetical protein